MQHYPYDEMTLISRGNTFFPATSSRLFTPIGCFQIRLRRITTATIKALTCFCLSPPQGLEDPSHLLCGWSLTPLSLSRKINQGFSDASALIHPGHKLFSKKSRALMVRMVRPTIH
jgi:hypothetical protein